MITDKTVVKGSSRSWSAIGSRWEYPSGVWPGVTPTGLWLIGAVLLSLALALCHSPLAPLPGVVTLLLAPGAAVMSVLRARPANVAGRLVVAVCLSMIVIMVVGGVASLIGPHLGIARPLNPLPEAVIWVGFAIATLMFCETHQCDPATWLFQGVRPPRAIGLLATGLLVALAILGAAQLNDSGDGHLAVASCTLDVLLLLAGIVGGWRRTSRWPLNTLLYSASLALLLSTSLRGGHLYGWDIQKEYGTASATIRFGVWRVPSDHDPYASMLSLTVLPIVLHSITRLRLLSFFQLVTPSILALLPLAVFSTIRAVPRWITSGRNVPRPGLAFAVVVALIVSSEAFSAQLVTITRQAMALTMVSGLVMVLFDRTILKRSAQIVIGVLIIGVSFTHYTTSYLLAAIVLCAWSMGLLWSRGWLGTPKGKIGQHRRDVHSRNIINGTLVCVALIASFGWNLAITRNGALDTPISAISSRGIGFTSSTLSGNPSPSQFERHIDQELKKSDRWIVPVQGASSVRLIAATLPQSPGVVPALQGPWNEGFLLVTEGTWIVLGVALLYGLFRLGRRRSYDFTSDLVGLGLAGLAIGGLLRFSGTLAAYYDPERAAIFTAILLAAPVTLLLDDIVSGRLNIRTFPSEGVRRLVLGVGAIVVAMLVVGATGLSSLIFGGEAPGSLSARDLQAEEFTVSAAELSSAVWLRDHVGSKGFVQTDDLGQVVLLSEPGRYGSLPEIIPPEVDQNSYVYLSTLNLTHDLSQAETSDGTYLAYRSNIKFFNENFFVVYSTGATRVYH